MKLIEGIEKIIAPYKNAVITIGNFDGVHIGHQSLFHEAIEMADRIGGTSIAMTFEPHPMKVVMPDGSHFPLITLYEQKVELITKTNIDVLIIASFTREFASISARKFVEDILVKRIGVKAMVVGEDYTFGRKREGNIELLKIYGEKLGFEVNVVQWIPIAGNLIERISSTAVRNIVMNGDMETTRRMLGRYYQIRGIVEKGRNRGGRLLGFPTANIHLYDELSPLNGVYAVIVELNKKYKGVANIGYSPTFGDHQFTVEVHILDFKGDIYGKKIKVNFVQRLRGEIKFNNIQELSNQIKNDIVSVREILSL
ncbi:FMN adenylyltransferase / Riboflavin kinase [Candidatus Magnetomoraceae bacterium gMMP-15]